MRNIDRLAQMPKEERDKEIEKYRLCKNRYTSEVCKTKEICDICKFEHLMQEAEPVADEYAIQYGWQLTIEQDNIVQYLKGSKWFTFRPNGELRFGTTGSGYWTDELIQQAHKIFDKKRKEIGWEQ